MANEPWPEALGSPQIAGYGYDDKPNELRTEVESGPAQVRTLFRSVPSTFPVTWLWTAAQFRLFESWWKFAAPSGTWFDLTLVTGAGEAVHAVRIVGAPKPRMKTYNRWIVTALLEVEERNTMSEEDMTRELLGDENLTLWAEAMGKAARAFSVVY